LKKLEKRTFYLIIIMIVLVLEILATAVQSSIISAKMCFYPSTNRSCAEEPFDCVDIFDIDTCGAQEEEDDEHCNGMTCDELKFERSDFTSWDTCHTTSYPGGADGIATCEDDGVTRCHGSDICLEICGFSNSGTCAGPCFEDSGVTIPGYDCDDYRTNVIIQTGMASFTDFEECFLHDDILYKFTGCPKASPTKSSMTSPTPTAYPTKSSMTSPTPTASPTKSSMTSLTPTASPTKSSITAPTKSSIKSSKRKRSSIDTGLIIGIAVSVAVLIFAIVTVIIVKRSQAIKNEAESEKAKSSIEVARVKHAIQA